MKVTVKQLKALIREAAEEAMKEMAHHEEEGKGMEEALQEAVAKAFRAGYVRGAKAASTRKASR
jgi:hypothetical protein